MAFLDRILEAGRVHLDCLCVREYLAQRGMTWEQALDFGLGYFPDEVWPPRVEATTDDGKQWAEWSRNGWRLKGKLLFPMINATGQVRGLQVRSPSPDVKDYSKFYLRRASSDAVFFASPSAMQAIWETGEVYLCEGLFDLPPLARLFPNTLCMGTANVSNLQIQFLLRYVHTIHVAFDNDWGGDRFWKEFKRDYSREFKLIRRVVLSEKDPGAMWEALGEARFREVLMRHVAF
jgi:DNA primase